MRYKKRRLYQWVREGKGHMVPPMLRKRAISECVFLGKDTIPISDLLQQIEKHVNSVTGDFRQEEILRIWKQTISMYLQRFPSTVEFPILHAKITAASGTYIRSIAYDIGNVVGTGALTWYIKRTQIGEYSLADVAFRV